MTAQGFQRLMTLKTLCLFAIAATLAVATLAKGATHGDSPAKATHGAVQVATASATQVFTGLLGRNAYIIYNNGPNTIWCGFNSAVTNVTGFPVKTSTALSVDLVYASNTDKDFYCRADTADQVSPADTRWIQVK